MPKSALPLRFKSEGYTYELTDTVLREPNDSFHVVLLKDLAKAWRNPDALFNSDEGGVNLPQRSNYFWVSRREDGSMNIGCRHFSPLKTAMILKAAGIRVGTARKKAKSKAKARKARSTKR